MSHLYPHLPNLLLVFSAFAVAVGSPGPSTMMIMATAMNAGRKAALVLALGVTTGSFTWGILSAIGVSAMIAAHAGALIFIKIAGGFYLLYLAWRSGRSALRSDMAALTAPDSAPHSMRRTYMRGYLMHLTNPKAILGWTAIMALGLSPGMPAIVIVTMLAGCLLISLTLNGAYALAFSTTPMINGYRRARRWIEGVLAGLFAFAGLKLLMTRFSAAP
ncbi:MAG: LysE family translocator [Beijerinckiaceae bacterium]